MINFHNFSRPLLSLFEETSKEKDQETNQTSKKTRGRPSKLKAVSADPIIENVLPAESPNVTEVVNSEPEFNELEVSSPKLFDEESASWTEETPREEFVEQENLASYSEETDSQMYSEDYNVNEDRNVSESRDFSQNTLQLSFSWSLMNQIRNLAKSEGISVADLVIELVAEGVTKRAFEDQSRQIPSHLMTRTGYVHPDGNQQAAQPHLSHHTNNRQQVNNNLQNRNRFNPNSQQRNSMGQNRNFNNNRNNYQTQGGSNLRPNNNNNSSSGFRNQYNNNGGQQQRFSRPNNNYQNNQQQQRPVEDPNLPQNGNNYKSQKDFNKR